MLQLYLGRAKSGKTAAVTQAIRARVNARVGGSVLLVPEWYSYEAEIELLRVCGDRLSLYGEVLSFSGLASRAGHYSADHLHRLFLRRPRYAGRAETAGRRKSR